MTRKQSMLVSPDAVAGASKDHDDSDPFPFDPINAAREPSNQTSMHDQRDDIVFEYSVSKGSELTNDGQSNAPDGDTLGLGSDLEPVKSRSTMPSVSDEEVEFVTRGDTAFSLTDTDTHGPSDPSLTLHIQMSLYPMTLADYLRSTTIQSDEDTSLTFTHCYHPQAALNIFLAILSGVDYLHSHSVVHRDLKPANIFLHPQLLTRGQQRPTGSVNPLDCRDCLKPNDKHPPPQETSMKVCIGDFGLVSAIKSDTATSPSSNSPLSQNPPPPTKAVGTELYRPHINNDGIGDNNGSTHNHRHQPHAGLDVYALGIILFELLYHFDTRMERHHTLSRLRRHGTFPDDFEVRTAGCEGLERLILRLLRAGGGSGTADGNAGGGEGDVDGGGSDDNNGNDDNDGRRDADGAERGLDCRILRTRVEELLLHLKEDV